MQATDVIVIGAGIGGLSAALALQRAGLKVRVYEQAAALGEIGAGLSISPNGALGLRALGVYDAFRDLAYAPDEQVLRHHRSGRILSRVIRGETLEEAFGARYFVIHRGDLHRVLTDAVHAHDPEAVVTGQRCVDLEQDEDGISARFDGGREVRGDILIGADGVRSRIRSSLFGAEAVHFTGVVAWRALVPMERVPLEALDPPSQLFVGPGRMLNRYPVSGGRWLNVVAFGERGGWQEEGWSLPGDLAELKAEFAGWHESVRQVIEAIPPETLFKWALCTRSPLMRWIRGRCALLGDAAHPLLPYLGQGAVMAIEDAVLLGRAFASAEDWSQALARYEAARVGRARLVAERSALQVLRLHAADPDSIEPLRAADESLGLFGYDPALVPV